MARSVLVIEDDLECLGVIRRFLETRGYEARGAATAAEGAEQVLAARPDLILLDIHLPGVDGIQLYKMFKKAAQTRGVPIILMTGEDILDAILEAAAGGLQAEAVYRKGSLDLEDLMKRVRRALSKSRREPEMPFNPGADGTILCRGPVVADLLRREVRILGGPVLRFSSRPFELLAALLRQDGPVSARELRRQVWPGSADLKAVGVTVMRLRRALEPARILRIETVGDSYRLVIGSGEKS